MQVPSSAALPVLLWISALLGRGPAGQVVASSAPHLPPGFLQTAGMVRVTAGWKGVTRRDEREVSWGVYFSSKSPWELLCLPRSGTLCWGGGLGRVSRQEQCKNLEAEW